MKKLSIIILIILSSCAPKLTIDGHQYKDKPNRPQKEHNVATLAIILFCVGMALGAYIDGKGWFVK